jgi:hypothetical protein
VELGHACGLGGGCRLGWSLKPERMSGVLGTWARELVAAAGCLPVQVPFMFKSKVRVRESCRRVGRRESRALGVVGVKVGTRCHRHVTLIPGGGVQDLQVATLHEALNMCYWAGLLVWFKHVIFHSTDSRKKETKWIS